MTTMDFLPSDLDQVPSNFLDMIENDINSQFLDLDNFNSEKLNEFVLNNDLSQDDLPLDFDENSKDVSTWLQHFQSWNDVSKVPQSLIDASNENIAENKNPNLLVNPQSVLPVISSHQQDTPNANQNLNVRNGVPIKINGQDAILTPTQNPNIQYVTVQNVGTDSLNNTQIGYTVQPVTLCQQVQQIRTSTSLSQNSPVLVEHLRNGYTGVHIINNNNKLIQPKKTEKCWVKPIYSYSCLIAMALKNSKTGNLPVSEIYTFMTENFPYFKTAPDGWKNSVRHNLSLNKCFAKVESAKPVGAHTRKGCLWALNPAKVLKMEEEIVKWRKKDPESVKHSMANPEKLELIESGKAGLPSCPKEPPVIEEPASPVIITSEPPTPVKPEPATPQLKKEPSTLLTKKPGNVIRQPASVVRQPGNVIRQPGNVIGQSGNMIRQPKLEIRREAGVMVKTEPDTEPMLVDLKDLAALGQGFNLDPAGLTELGLQTGLWDDEMHTDTSVSLSATVPQLNMPCQPAGLQSPVKAHSVGTQYQGNITYTCGAAASPIQPNSPMYNTTPTKNYAQTPTKVVYPQTPTRIIIA